MMCPKCSGPMEKIWFEQEERDSKTGYLTGRVRDAVSHLTCKWCLHNECVDDSMDHPWRKK